MNIILLNPDPFKLFRMQLQVQYHSLQNGICFFSESLQKG